MSILINLSHRKYTQFSSKSRFKIILHYGLKNISENLGSKLRYYKDVLSMIYNDIYIIICGII